MSGTASARSVDEESAGPSCEGARRERAGADGQQADGEAHGHGVFCPRPRCACCSAQGVALVAQGYLRGLQRCIRPVRTRGFCRGDISALGGLPGCTRRLAGDGRFIWSQRRLPAWLEPPSSRYQSKYELARGGGETRGSSKRHGHRTHFREVDIRRHSKKSSSGSALTT